MSAVKALPLRDYQRAGVDALAADWRAGLRRLAMVWPTGAGKTVAFAEVSRRVVEAGGKTLVLVHRDELVRQAVDKLRAVTPVGAAAPGVVKGSRNELAGRRVVVASVQSLRRAARRAEVAAWGPSLVIVDECHHAVAPTYLEALRAFGCFEPDGNGRGALALGVTATLTRGDNLALGEVWQKISHKVDILDLVRRRYLLKPRGRRVRVDGLDLRAVKRSRGDYADGSLGHAMMECLAPAAIARAYREHAGDRQGVVFLPTVQTAYATRDALREVGITAECIEGAMPAEERALALKRSAGGDVQVLTNCMVLTEGTDLPHVDVGVIGRPTLHAGLYVQMVGRTLRPYPGQEEALILDVVGVGARHKLAGVATLLGVERIEALADELTDDELAELDLLGLAELQADVTGAGVRDLGMVDGTLVAEEFELFEKSHRTWLQTRRGVWFIEAGVGNTSQVIFLVPRGEGKYSVAAVPTKASGGRWVAEDMDIGYAMSWGEQAAATLGGYTHRSASWRRAEASGEQLRYARVVGAELGELTRGAVSDAIGIARATARIDHLPMVAGVSR